MATRLEVMKWAFLLQVETPSRGGPSFYQFLPYKYGPFSFCLQQEASLLVSHGFIEDVDGRKWRLRRAGIPYARAASPNVRHDIVNVLRVHRSGRVSDLLDQVYDRYPWYTVNSERGSRINRPVAEQAVYTAGYAGLLVDGFLDGLLRNGMQRLIDVRNNPVSRRYGFHGSTLSRLCGYLGVEYVHVPELGIESAARQHARAIGSVAGLLDRYEQLTLPKQDWAVRRVAALVRERPSVLVCMEADPFKCHRSRLARVVGQYSGLPVRHLEKAT